MISYFDDFGALILDALAKQGLQTFKKWCQILGISLKSQKSDVVPQIALLALLGTSPPGVI